MILPPTSETSHHHKVTTKRCHQHHCHRSIFDLILARPTVITWSEILQVVLIHQKLLMSFFQTFWIRLWPIKSISLSKKKLKMFPFNCFWTAKVTWFRDGARELRIKYRTPFTLKFGMKIILFQWIFTLVWASKNRNTLKKTWWIGENGLRRFYRFRLV